MNKHLTLESVQADFHQWRQTKTSSRSRIPEHLKQKAASLLMDMKPGKITKALGISSVMLKAWAGINTTDSDSRSVVEFIALPVEPMPVTSENLSLNVTQPNGNQWCLQGNMTESQLNVFIRTVGTLPGIVQ